MCLYGNPLGYHLEKSLRIIGAEQLGPGALDLQVLQMRCAQVLTMLLHHEGVVKVCCCTSMCMWR